MVDNILLYIFFFGVVSEVYFLAVHKYRWILLLAASYCLYTFWMQSAIWVLLAVTAVSYVAGLIIARTNKKTGRVVTAVCVVTIVSLMIAFKYLGFLTLSVNDLLRIFHLPARVQYLSFIQPLGIMFFSLKAISYVVDVYRRTIPAEKHIGYYALYIAFFPLLVAGPIERASTMLSQFRQKHPFNYIKAREGAFLIAYGFFKKMVIADQLGVIVTIVYKTPDTYIGYQLMTATVLFAIQIYCDFSGYSDIAIGSAKLLGFQTGPNFNNPYAAVSIRDFWDRWHISFSSWLKDYVYIPLGGSRVSPLRNNINILITFLISGLWHGANWTFVVWGLIHAGYLIGGNLYRNRFPRWTKWPVVRVPAIFVLVCIAWIFFRADTIHDATYILTHLFVNPYVKDFSLLPKEYITQENTLEYMRYMFIIFLLIQAVLSWRKNIGSISWPLRWALYYVLVISVMAAFYIYGGDVRTFIYATF